MLRIQALTQVEAKLTPTQLTLTYFIAWDLYPSLEEITKKILPRVPYA